MDDATDAFKNRCRVERNAVEAGSLSHGKTASSEVPSRVEQDGRRRRTPQPLPLTPRSLDTGLGSLDQVRALLLRDPPKDSDEERTNGTARIEPALANAQDRNPETIKQRLRRVGVVTRVTRHRGEYHLHLGRVLSVRRWSRRTQKPTRSTR